MTRLDRAATQWPRVRAAIEPYDRLGGPLFRAMTNRVCQPGPHSWTMTNGSSSEIHAFWVDFFAQQAKLFRIRQRRRGNILADLEREAGVSNDLVCAYAWVKRHEDGRAGLHGKPDHTFVGDHPVRPATTQAK